MTTPLTPPPARTIADLDRPLPELEAAIRATRRRYIPSPQEVARQAAAMELCARHAAERGKSLEDYARSGGIWDRQHLLHDADPDSTIPVIRISLIKERAA